jgi:hypothetical protein
LYEQFKYSLDAWQIHLEDSMKRTVDLQESFFQHSDHAMAQVCGNLLETAKVLVAANDNRDFGNGSNHHG